MNNRKKPGLEAKHGYLIVCEGAEETDYVNRLRQCGVWKERTRVKNAGSIDNIRREFTYEYKMGEAGKWEHVVVFCDTEERPYAQFEKMSDGIIADCGADVAESVFFANPNSMQVILLHFDSVLLTHNGKSANAPKIEKLTGVEDYDAGEHKRAQIMQKIDADNYAKMKQRLRDVCSEDHEKISSTNVGRLFDALEV